MRKIRCCYECTNRHTACHDTCEEYKAEKALINEERKHIQRQMAEQADLDTYFVDKAMAMKRDARYMRPKK